MTVVEKPRISKDNFILHPVELWCKTENFMGLNGKRKEWEIL